MSSDLAVRLLVVAAVGLAVSTVGFFWMRRGQGSRGAGSNQVRTVEGLGPWPALLLFTSADCSSCGPVRDAVEAERLEYREVRWDADPERFRASGVESVPLLVEVDAAGRVVAAIPGMPSARSLRSMGSRHRADPSRS